jgi:hypothetical protein
MWWATDDYGEVNVWVHFEVEPSLSPCEDPPALMPVYRWRYASGRVVANSRLALDLTPSLAPEIWLDDYDYGCYDAPITRREIAHAREHGVTGLQAWGCLPVPCERAPSAPCG